MTYLPTTWVDNSTPALGAANLNHAETGIANALDKTDMTAKGDLLVATASGAYARLAVGANDTVAVADSAQTTGVKWVQVGNAQVAAGAAIAYAKLNLAASVVNADIAAAAGIAGTKLGTDVARIYDRATATVDVNTSIAETSIYTKVITGGDMGTNRMLRLTMAGDYLHNNVAGDTLTARIKFGGATIWQDASSFVGVISATRHGWEWIVDIANKAAANSQFMWSKIATQKANEVAPTAGLGKFQTTDGSMSNSVLSSNGPNAIDTSVNQTLDITVQWSASSANNSWRLFYATLELV